MKDSEREELLKKINNLELEIKTIKKYGLIWDAEKTEEEVVTFCKNNIPVLTNYKKFNILSEDGINNILIEGDNFHSLTCLNFSMREGIDIIYIDPPYNTGHEDFAYNDKFIDYEDGYRHSKWLSFMKKRLILAKELLKKDGLIFISINDIEYAQLKLLCDSVFGEKNLVNIFHWVSNLKGRQLDGMGAAGTTEYIICYSKNRNIQPAFEENDEYLKEIMPSAYSSAEYEIFNDKYGEYVIKNELFNTNSAFNEETRPNLIYDLYYNPKTKDILTSDVSDENLFSSKGYIKISPHKNSDGKHKYHAFRWDRNKIRSEPYNLYFTNDSGKWKVFTKVRDVHTIAIKDLIMNISTSSGSSDLKKMKLSFNSPKPVKLIELILRMKSNKNATILDFFAGSGTTGHAVLELNKKDGGNRKFILCTNNEISEYNKIKYIQNHGYLESYKLPSTSKSSTLKKKVIKFAQENPAAYKKLFIENREELESYGICQSVTYQRIKTIISGKCWDGSKYKTGNKLPANLYYFKTEFIRDKKSRDQTKYDLVEKVDSLLCILEDCYEEVERNSYSSHFISTDKKKHMFIYNEHYNEKWFAELKLRVERASGQKIVYIYTSSNDLGEITTENKDKSIILKPIPSKIYEIYKEISNSLKRGE